MLPRNGACRERASRGVKRVAPTLSRGVAVGLSTPYSIGGLGAMREWTLAGAEPKLNLTQLEEMVRKNPDWIVNGSVRDLALQSVRKFPGEMTTLFSRSVDSKDQQEVETALELISEQTGCSSI